MAITTQQSGTSPDGCIPVICSREQRRPWAFTFGNIGHAYPVGTNRTAPQPEFPRDPPSGFELYADFVEDKELQ